MPKVLIERPNRSHERPFGVQDAARVMCYAIGGRTLGGPTGRAGAGKSFGRDFERGAQEIVAIARERCGDPKMKFDLTEAAAAVAADQQLENDLLNDAYRGYLENNTLFLQLLEWFGALLTFLTALIFVARLIPIPAVRLVAVGAGRILTRVTAFQGAIIARRAANDGRMDVLLEVLRARKALRAA